MAGSRLSAVLSGVQRHLEAIYDLEVEARVEDFVIGTGQMDQLVALGLVEPALTNTDEQLLVLPDDDGLAVALYLSDGLQDSLGVESSLQAHCHVTEGVSHFVMVLWTALQERQVRRLHLEIQAEVDKVTTCLLLDRGTTGGSGGQALLRRLFDGVSLVPHLDPEERDRYLLAHRLAGDYARHLLVRLDRGVEELLAELRAFYRLSLEGKRVRMREAA